MTFSIKTTMRAFAAPSHQLNCPPRLWGTLIAELDRRGERQHEAGAFLLGETSQSRRTATDLIFYDQLDANAYSTGVCILYAPAFAALWTICRERGLTVVADVHTHGGAARQSLADKTNPMVARAGHIAIIVPNFAASPVPRNELGIYEYLGDHSWIDRSPRVRSGYLYSGIWS